MDVEPKDYDEFLEITIENDNQIIKYIPLIRELTQMPILEINRKLKLQKIMGCACTAHTMIVYASLPVRFFRQS
jgi:hypothetical protein